MLNTMRENENTGSANIWIPFLESTFLPRSNKFQYLLF